MKRHIVTGKSKGNHSQVEVASYYIFLLTFRLITDFHTRECRTKMDLQYAKNVPEYFIFTTFLSNTFLVFLTILNCNIYAENIMRIRDCFFMYIFILIKYHEI